MAFNKEAFDLFAFLDALNKRDMEAYSKLSEEGQKAAHPLVVMRWLSGTGDQAQIVRLNSTANRCIFALGSEKALLFKLLAAACTGPKRNNWIKGPGSSKSRLATMAISAKYGCSTREAEEHFRMLEPADVLQLAEQAGWEKDQIKKLQVELGIETKVKKK